MGASRAPQSGTRRSAGGDAAEAREAGAEWQREKFAEILEKSGHMYKTQQIHPSCQARKSARYSAGSLEKANADVWQRRAEENSYQFSN